MNDAKETREVSYWDRRLLARAILVGVVFFVIFLGLAKQAEPPVGYVFKRLPVVGGVYRCCEAGGRYSKSWVGPLHVNCLGFSYFHMGRGRNDCGKVAELNGRSVAVERALLPAYDGMLPLVSKIASGGMVCYELSDQEMRDLWISGSHRDATFGFTLGLIFHFFQLVFLSRRFVKLQEE